jgi:hypothetical protein
LIGGESDAGLLLLAGLENAPTDQELAAYDWAGELLETAAECVLSAFASRLVAFHDADFPFLYENLLAGPGVIRLHGRRIDVHLPPVPLSLVLRLAGFHGREVAPPWLGGRAVRLVLP